MVTTPETTSRHDHTGTARRLQALVAIGYPQRELAARLGISAAALSGLLHRKHGGVTGKTHYAVVDLFKELWAHPVPGRSGQLSRTLARKWQWVGPLAWDNIDDPAETANPHGSVPALATAGAFELDPRYELDIRIEIGLTGPYIVYVISVATKPELIDEIAVELAISGEPVKLTFAERRVAVARLHAQRWGDPRIAATLHVTDRTVLRIRQELGLESFDYSEIRQARNA